MRIVKGSQAPDLALSTCMPVVCWMVAACALGMFVTPQYFWMRVAMGLALNEGEHCNARAVEFYEALSTFRFVPSARPFATRERLSCG